MFRITFTKLDRIAKIFFQTAKIEVIRGLPRIQLNSENYVVNAKLALVYREKQHKISKL
ncbi:hypothetical protein LEP1GSC073_1259 [Leptospira noguchii str. Cascata]|nr:hypothetical protein LEP1GSC073_1259 [Leptospira noguchii str. Cascata]